MRGKTSAEYAREVAMVDLSGPDLIRLNLAEGQFVRVTTEYGSGRFAPRKAEVPAGIAFIPFGPPCNRLIGSDTQGTGMPDSKGLPAVVDPDPDSEPNPGPDPDPVGGGGAT